MTDDSDGESIDVLLVEDNPGDVRLVEEAFDEIGGRPDLHVVTDGESALDFLFRRGDYADAPWPDLVLLDLNLPKVDGEAVLREIKDDPDLTRIPVIVLTSSDSQTDVLRSYELHSNAYLTKPVSPDEFVDLVRCFENFWIDLARLPPKPD